MPSHSRMRAFDRDLIRGGHYGQRPCEPHLKAEHMAAPTNAANVKKVLANSRTSQDVRLELTLIKVDISRPDHPGPRARMFTHVLGTFFLFCRLGNRPLGAVKDRPRAGVDAG